jgi:hypothetical protein
MGCDPVTTGVAMWPLTPPGSLHSLWHLNQEDPPFRYREGEMRVRLTGAVNELPEREHLVMIL